MREGGVTGCWGDNFNPPMFVGQNITLNYGLLWTSVISLTNGIGANLLCKVPL